MRCRLLKIPGAPRQFTFCGVDVRPALPVVVALAL